MYWIQWSRSAGLSRGPVLSMMRTPASWVSMTTLSMSSSRVLHLPVQGQRRFHRGLGMEFRGKGNLEQHVFHNVTAEGAFRDDFIAAEQHVLEAPWCSALSADG